LKIRKEKDMKKTVLNSYSAPQIEFYNVAIERGFIVSEGVGLPEMPGVEDELE
jgi:hypothetical protein